MNFKSYFTPKSMVYTGKHKDVESKFKVYVITKDEVIESKTYEIDQPHMQYIQVIGLTDTKKIETLGKDLGIDALVLEDILNVRQRDKFEIYEQYIFGVFKVRYLQHQSIKEGYMSLVMFQNILISFHETDPDFLDQLPNLFKTHKEINNNTIDYMFYEILDIATDHIIEVNDYLKDEMESIEEDILGEKITDQESFYQIRKQLLKIKNSISPIYEHLLEIIKTRRFIAENNMPYYEDLLDHLRRLDLDLAQSREIMRHLMDVNINNQSNRMNKIMTTLTLFSAIFIPLSFLTGFFGMNFIHFGILAYPQAVGIFVLFCVLVAITMFFIFKRAKWL